MSKIEVNAIEPQCGTTLTIGASDTNIAGIGTVNWDTTAKTAAFTAVSGRGYFVNTTSGAITLTLPASPSAGDIVAFKDYAFTFATNNLTVDGNGSPIGGVNGIVNPTYNTNGTSKTFIYVDGTKGWLVTNESTDTSQEQNAQFITATGGTVTCCGDYKIHTFTGPGTFTVSCVGNPAGSDTVDYLVVAGGGSGGNDAGGGGGAGGFRESSGTASGCYSTSPLGACVSALPVTAQGYPITVGSGGTNPGSPQSPGTQGSNSIFSTITSSGGGGGSFNSPFANKDGGSGGGARGACSQGIGNTPPVSPPQGNPGGDNSPPGGSGGGGAGAAGATASAGAGGNGVSTSISSSSTAYAGGGGGGNNCTAPGGGSGGTGGGGDGGARGGAETGGSGTTNTGGGGGGSGGGPANANAGSGGSGIVIIRYKFQ